jgi:hypothetical protein
MDSQDLRLSPYTDGVPPQPLINPLIGSLSDPPPCAVHTPKTQAEFDSLAIRIPTFFLVYVARDVPPLHIQELALVHDATRVPCVVLDAKLMPNIEIGFGRMGPFWGKMYKHQLLRFMDCEPTFKNICSFAKSERQWRGMALST